MGQLFDAGDIDPGIRRIIRAKARALVRSAGYLEDDVEDITQDLILHLLLHPVIHDTSRGSLSTVVRWILDRKIVNMVAARYAVKRDVRRCQVSLDDPVRLGDNESGTIHDVYNMDSYLQITGKTTQSLMDLRMLASKVKSVLASLPPELRMIAEMLKDQRKGEIARELGIPRSTLYDACRRLREIFIAHNLEEYL